MRRRVNQKTRSAGFSLLEVMVAVAILAVSFMALFHLQSTSLMGSARARRISISTQLARLKMASVLIDFETGMKKGEFPDQKEESGTFEEEKFPDYGWKLTIHKVEIPAPPVPEGQAAIFEQVFKMVAEQLSENTREIKLTVYWKESDDAEEEAGIVLTTHMVKM